MSASDRRRQESDVADGASIITGAGSGLGRALAEALSKHGRPLVLVGRRRDRLMQTRDACLAAGNTIDKCYIAPADVAQQGAAERVVAETIGAYGSIAASVNNAAFAHFAPIADPEPRQGSDCPPGRHDR